MSRSNQEQDTADRDIAQALKDANKVTAGKLLGSNAVTSVFQIAVVALLILNLYIGSHYVTKEDHKVVTDQINTMALTMQRMIDVQAADHDDLKDNDAWRRRVEAELATLEAERNKQGSMFYSPSAPFIVKSAPLNPVTTDDSYTYSEFGDKIPTN